MNYCMKSIVVIFLITSGLFAAVADSFVDNKAFIVSNLNDLSGIIKDIKNEISTANTDKNNYLALGILYVRFSCEMENPDLEYSKTALKYLEKYQALVKNDPLGLLYLGIAHSLKARDTKNPFVQLGEVNTAVKYVDMAVKSSESLDYSWFIHFMRGCFYADLPKFFGKFDIAVKDFNLVINLGQNNDEIRGYFQAVYFYLGEIELKNNNKAKALENWKMAIEINKKYDGEPLVIKKAKQRMNEYK